MSLPKTVFKTQGGPVTVEVKVRSAQVATYTFWLWENNSSTIVTKRRGNNQNAEVDAYTLPIPCTLNHGRLVECAVVLIDPAGKGEYSVDLIIAQDGTILNTLNAQGNVAEGSTAVTFLTRLEKRP
jgi:hypothetical protein